jgi:hypothetical protein
MGLVQSTLDQNRDLAERIEYGRCELPSVAVSGVVHIEQTMHLA